MIHNPFELLERIMAFFCPSALVGGAMALALLLFLLILAEVFFAGTKVEKTVV